MISIRKTQPFVVWHDGLRDRQGRARITLHIECMKLGHFGDVKSVGGGVFEARLHFGPGYRLYFFRHDDEVVVLLAGGDKASQSADIALAKRIKINLGRNDA